MVLLARALMLMIAVGCGLVLGGVNAVASDDITDPAPVLDLAARTDSPTYQNGQSIALELRLTNRSAADCEVPLLPDGSVRIEQVLKDGRPVAASMGSATYLDRLDFESAASRQVLRRDESAVLSTVRPAGLAGIGLGLEQVIALPNGVGLLSVWDVSAPGDYAVTVRYVPLPIRGGLDQFRCHGSTPAQSVSFAVADRSAAQGSRSESRVSSALVFGAVALLVVALLAAAWWWRRRHRAGRSVVGSLIIVLVVGTTMVAPERPAAAVITGDPEAQEALAACLALYHLPGFDPAGTIAKLERSDARPVEVRGIHVPPNGQGTKTDRLDRDDPTYGSYIQWDPHQLITRDNVTFPPCVALYHELTHAADAAHGIDHEVGTCPGSTVPVADVHAVAAENALRALLNLTQRTTYGGAPVAGLDFAGCLQLARERNSAAARESELMKYTRGRFFGDPHLITLDGLAYDLQAVGEFTALTARDDAIELQVRMVAVPGSTSASMARAAVLKVGDDRLEFAQTSGGITVAVNGLAVSPASEPLPVGAGVATMVRGASASSSTGELYRVEWIDGFGVTVDSAADTALSVQVRPTAADAGRIYGLLGDFDGRPENDLTTRSGHSVGSNPEPEQLYGEFAESWRVTDATSLFRYGPAESTATFTDRGFPRGVPAISDQQRRAAAFSCAAVGLSSGPIYDGCLLDVAVTGSPGMAVAAGGFVAAMDAATPPGPGATTGTAPTASLEWAPGATVTGTRQADDPPTVYTFDAVAGQRAFLAGDPACTDPKSQWTVSSVTGSLGEYHGVVDVCHDLGRVAFAQDGRYRIEVSGPGAYRLTWMVVPPDRVAPISFDAPMGGEITAPGERHILTFDAAAGDRLTFVSELPCQPATGLLWYVVTADGSGEGRGIADSCVSYGPIELAHAGAYQLIIDSPNRNALGSYRFTVQR